MVTQLLVLASSKFYYLVRVSHLVSSVVLPLLTYAPQLSTWAIRFLDVGDFA